MAEETAATLDDYNFDQGEAGASLTIPMEAGQIRKGGHIVIKGHPCKVVSVSTSKTGKHGHAKCNFTATDIFTGKKYEDIVPSTHNTTVPNVFRNEYQLLDIQDDGFLSLMDDAGDTKEDIKLPEHPEGFKEQIQSEFDSGKSLAVTVLSAMGHSQVIAIKEDSS
ncbi:unnamed protein product [Heterosigma akashiwo]|mmetsp:Transcript_53841/g.78639  ORF Transcript_53841/g.78639 Transcript_53841/m.78639 type:complete len:165 (+) Transcript_53841:108-602(+)|eukprot:CAMPEP_0194580722 /NCGR_PEP_ID=MMETSP0292-20121207/14401_1 /TAXON_ID=39354 /ORGANISM="Heterosigma akashiwo, Strain CCMP2393" /LENGTH=164 /DNA_ID=CAMNT_0039434183 /DNA_START=44 /DNA_END=538 /DNA_ORIENTATION=-